MQEQIQNGILEEVTEPTPNEKVQSTKLPVVYDFSAKISSEQPSLNDCLETGPPLQPHLFDILMRARTHKYLLTGDIKKALKRVTLTGRGCFGTEIWSTMT